MMRKLVIGAPVLALFWTAAVAFAVAPEDEAETTPAPAASVQGGEEAGQLVVTATRVETPPGELASSTTIITRDEIENSGKVFVLDLLREVPGLDVVRNGGPGQPAAVFIRGAKSEHTLVMVDGVEVNDPFTPGRTFDFAHLTTENIERIEIIRGPQSTLYGSDAIGGVINIITRKGRGKPALTYSAEAGSFETFKSYFGVSGASEPFDYSLGVSLLDTEGISAAGRKYGNREDDAYENTTLSGRLGWTADDCFDMSLIFRYTDADGDQDNAGGAFGDDPNYTFDNEMMFTRAQGRLWLLEDVWEQVLGVSFTDYDRKFRNRVDPAHPIDWLRARYRADLLKFDWQHNFYVHPTNTVTLGLETEEERGRSEWFSDGVFGPTVDIAPRESARTNGFYAQDQLSVSDRFFATLGVRLDDHDSFGSETTYRVAPAYRFPETGTKVKGTYGTGFKAPTLFQLYSAFGNEDLKPEESKGWDVGVEQELCGGKVTAGITYFRNTFEDLIDYDWVLGYVNVGKARAEGVEVSARYQATDRLSFGATYTQQRTEDRATGQDLLRRPGDKASLDVNYGFCEGRANVNLDVVHVGVREDLDYSTWPATRVDLERCTLVNLSGSYQASENVRLVARVENLFDKKYEEVLGYASPGLGVFGGVLVSY